MMKKSHIAIGVIGAVIVSKHLGVSMPLAIIGASVGSILPDFDLKLGIPHRGITHWVLWPALIWLLFGWNALVFGLALGWALHIFADCLTVEGVRPLWPVRIRLNGFIRTGTLTEYLIVIPALLALLYRYIL